MASYEDSQFAFDILPEDEKLSTIYAEVFKVTTTLRGVSERLVALENLAFSPAPTLPPSVAAVSTGHAKSKKGKQKVAPPPTPSTGRSPAPPIAIQSVSTKAALEKTVVTLQIQEAQAGHLVGRAGNGLREVHDFSRAKVSVAPATGNTGLRPVTIRGSVREVGDALTAIGKRLARRRVRNPRAKKGKNKSAIPPAPAPVSPYVSVVPPPPSSWDGPPTPQVVVQPPTPSPSGGPYSSSLEPPPPSPMQLSTPAAPSGSATPSPMQLSTPSPATSARPPGTPMEVDALQALRASQVQTSPRGAAAAPAVPQPASSSGGSGPPGGGGRQTARRGRGRGH
jgi:hypothetical protein